MLKPRKKITKKQIKEDKFMTTVFKVQTFIELEWQKIVGGFAAIVLIILLSNYIQSSGAARENQASEELFQLEFRYYSAIYDSTLVSGLEGFIDRYEDTERAAAATFYLANTLFAMQSYVRAEEYFQIFLDDHDGPGFMKASALGGIGACYEQREMYDKAVEYYNRAAERYFGEFVTAENLLGAARSYIKLGDTEAAKEKLSRLVEEFPNTSESMQAEFMMAQI